MKIIVYYWYYPPMGKPYENYQIFTDRVKALRFIKKVDGKNFSGYVLRWECDSEYDNEWLYSRHTLHHPLER